MSSTLKLHVLATPLTRLRNRATNLIIDLPEKSSEIASETSAMCVKLFQDLGAEVFLSDIDITHRVHSRQQNGALKLIICKFVRCLAKASVMETRQSASQVNQSNIGVSADSVLDRVRIFDHLTSWKQNRCLKRRDVRNRNNTASAGPRIPLFIYEKMSVPYKITDIGRLRRFASETWHYEFKGLWFRPYKVLV